MFQVIPRCLGHIPTGFARGYMSALDPSKLGPHSGHKIKVHDFQSFRHSKIKGKKAKPKIIERGNNLIPLKSMT